MKTNEPCVNVRYLIVASTKQRNYEIANCNRQLRGSQRENAQTDKRKLFVQRYRGGKVVDYENVVYQKCVDSIVYVDMRVACFFFQVGVNIIGVDFFLYKRIESKKVSA